MQEAPGRIEGMGKFVSKKGHNARITGITMLVFGIAFALAGTYGEADKLMSFSALIAFAGFITFIVGIGLGRETPPTTSDESTSLPSSMRGNTDG